MKVVAPPGAGSVLAIAAHPDDVESGRAGPAPHEVRAVWLFASDAAVAAVDIAPAFERKFAARLEHRSQTADPAELRVHWRERAATIRSAAGLTLAEAFAILRPGDG